MINPANLIMMNAIAIAIGAKIVDDTASEAMTFGLGAATVKSAEPNCDASPKSKLDPCDVTVFAESLVEAWVKGWAEVFQQITQWPAQPSSWTVLQVRAWPTVTFVTNFSDVFNSGFCFHVRFNLHHGEPS